MTVNWAEVLIGGSLFFVIGALFSIFLQPSIERRVRMRREESFRRREAKDAEFRELVKALTEDPALFAAVSRGYMAAIVRGVLQALIFVLLSMLLDPFFYPAGGIFVVLAIFQIIPIGRSVKRLGDSAAAVADALLPPAPSGLGEQPTTGQ